MKKLPKQTQKRAVTANTRKARDKQHERKCAPNAKNEKRK